jgi:hypothetical protein
MQEAEDQPVPRHLLTVPPEDAHVWTSDLGKRLIWNGKPKIRYWPFATFKVCHL